MLLMVLVACSNLNDRAFNAEGGSRHATGEWNGWLGDTGGDSGGGGGGGDTDVGEVTDDSPVISGVTAQWATGDDGESYVDVFVACSDPQDDLVGGKVYFAYASGDATAEDSNRDIVEEAAWGDPQNEAGYNGAGVVELQVGPVDGTKDFAVTGVLLRDDPGNSSTEMDADVLEPEQ